MEIIKTSDFDRAFDDLPTEIKRLYITQEKRFKENWQDTRLHIKKVRALPFTLSLRITRRYRAFFYFKDSDTAIFFEIDHRKDIYR